MIECIIGGIKMYVLVLCYQVYYTSQLYDVFLLFQYHSL